MLNRFLSIPLAGLMAALGVACVQAETINYNETFAYSSSSTLLDLGGTSSTTLSGNFAGAVSPYYSWAISTVPGGSGTKASAGTATGSSSGLTLASMGSTKVYTTASRLIGSSAFDVSQNALTVSAVISGSASSGDGGNYSFGLLVGGLKIEIWPGYGQTLERVNNIGGNDLGFLATMNTAYTFTATISGDSSNGYSLTWSISTPGATTFNKTLAITATQLGAFSNVGVYIEDQFEVATTNVTSFSVTQVPEPGTAALLSSALFGLLTLARRKRRN
jgi:hypothetical protein